MSSKYLFGEAAAPSVVSLHNFVQYLCPLFCFLCPYRATSWSFDQFFQLIKVILNPNTTSVFWSTGRNLVLVTLAVFAPEVVYSVGPMGGDCGAAGVTKLVSISNTNQSSGWYRNYWFINAKITAYSAVWAEVCGPNYSQCIECN